jgi:arylsulfatase A-like enzyme
MVPEATERPPLWTWAFWFAALTGLTQALLVALGRLLSHRLILISSDVVWMAPLADAAVFACAAFGLQLTTRHLRRSTVVRWSLSSFMLLFLLGPVLLVPRLHPYAAVLLAIGAAVQAGRMLGRRIDRFDAIARRTLPGLIGLSAILGLGLHFSRSLAETRADASRPRSRAATPSVLLLVLDTVRAQNLSLYGYARQTSPHLDSFAESGVVFERALSTSPWTLPSHASLFTGRLPHELSADWLTSLDAEHPTVAELFADAGYVTGGFVGNLLYATRDTGLDRGFVRYDDYPISTGTIITTSWLGRMLISPVWTALGTPDRVVRKSAADVNSEFFSWLDARPARPFLAFLNYFDAHEPYLPSPPFDRAFGAGGPQPDISVRRSWSALEIQRSMDAYDGAVAYLDEQIGRLLDGLRARGALDNTLVVITSDHGEQFGEHGLFDHGNSLYRQVLQVPLTLSLPGRVPAGSRVSEPVSLAALPATIVDLTGVPQGNLHLPGRSLAEYWMGPPGDGGRMPGLLAEVSKGINLPDWLPAAKGPMKSVVVGGMHYIRHSDGREELYDFDRDVAELHDLSTRSEARAALEESRRTLNNLLKQEARTSAVSAGVTALAR